MYSSDSWRPTKITRVVRGYNTSTKPLHVVTDAGPALVKYIGNRQGNDALISELIAARLARIIGLETPDFAILDIEEISEEKNLIQTQSGPAFFSKWEQGHSLGPESTLIKKIRNQDDISVLVVFDTWIRNKDRFYDHAAIENVNYDNVLIVPDKRKARLLVIDHSHAFADIDIETELVDGWADEEIIYGLFNEFKPLLNKSAILGAISKIKAVDIDSLSNICLTTPAEWNLTRQTALRFAELLHKRAQNLPNWLPFEIFAQGELNI